MRGREGERESTRGTELRAHEMTATLLVKGKGKQRAKENNIMQLGKRDYSNEERGIKCNAARWRERERERQEGERVEEKRSLLAQRA